MAEEAAARDHASDDDGRLGLRPLTARSVLLSILLEAHPARMSVRSLVRAGELFGVVEGTVRVALSRMTSDGEVEAEAGQYQLNRRWLRRQRRQDESRQPSLRPWDGTWQLAIIPSTLNANKKLSLVTGLVALRLGQIREGVWGRPDNLERGWPSELDAACYRMAARPEEERALAATIWDLDGWTHTANALLRAMCMAGPDGTWVGQSPARRFVIAVAMVRHMREDPVLPDALLPNGWPGPRLRSAYARFEGEFGQFLRDRGALRA